MKKTTNRKPVAQRIAAGMAELEQAMRSDKPAHELFTIRTVEISDPSVYDATAVRNMRNRLHVSQAVFAKLLGASVELVEHWEQGRCVPRGVVRQLLDEINRDPSGFLTHHIGQTERRLSKAG
jgi:putative transcriptional regulator